MGALTPGEPPWPVRVRTGYRGETPPRQLTGPDFIPRMGRDTRYLCPAAPSGVPGLLRLDVLEGRWKASDRSPLSWTSAARCPCPSPPNPAWPGNRRPASAISLESGLQGPRDGDESPGLKIKRVKSRSSVFPF